MAELFNRKFGQYFGFFLNIELVFGEFLFYGMIIN